MRRQHSKPQGASRHRSRNPSVRPPPSLNDAQQEQLAYRLAEAVSALRAQEAAESGPDRVLADLRAALASVESNPPWPLKADLKDAESLSKKLVGLPSFLRAVQNQPEKAQQWDSLPPNDPLRLVKAERLWMSERLS